MTTAAVPAGRSLLGKLQAAVSQRRRGRSGKPGQLAAFAAAAREHVVTVAALVSADMGAWHWGPGTGWLVTAGSLLAFDFAVRG